MSIQNLVKFSPFILIKWSKNQSLITIKGHNSVVNLRKTKIYITNVDTVYYKVYTKFGLNLSIYVLKIWSKNQILTSIQGRNSVENLQKKNNDLQEQGRSCQW